MNRTAIVYSMGKVGSSSIAHAVEDSGSPCYHIHTLCPQSLLKFAKRDIERGALPPGHISASMFLKKKKQKNALYITCVREPVARNLSAFFQNIRMLLNSDIPDSPAGVLERFLSQYPHDLSAEWLDNEFNKQLGIDVYASTFDPVQKYASGENWVLFRTDCPDKTMSEMLSDRLGKKIAIDPRNIGDKKHGGLYAETKALAMPEDYLSRMYSTKYARHFWTPEEREELKRKWMRNPAA